MLDSETKSRIDSARDILVGKVPDPKSQVEQITIALIYKFMDDMDRQSEELGGKATFFSQEYKKYSWPHLLDPRLGGHERLLLYAEGIEKMNQNKNIPQLFRDIFKGTFLPYRDPETLNLFLKEINGFVYDHSERLGDAFEYLLSVLGSQGEAGQFRTPRHIIDFIVKIVDPKKNETVLDPACGTAGFLISSFKHIMAVNTKERPGDLLSADERGRLMTNFNGYDISPDMVRLSRVNMYLHGFAQPRIYEYDTLTSEERWGESFDVILANPPFMTPKGGIRPHNRFSIKANRSEVLFVDFIAEHLSTGGRAGIIVPEGIIFQSQNAYKALRKMLIENYLWAVVSLPGGCFNPYSGVKTSILFLDKSLAKRTDEILFMKIEGDGFGLGAQRRANGKNDLPEALRDIADFKLRISGLKKSISSNQQSRINKLQSVAALSVKKSRILESTDINLSGDRYRETVALHSKWPIVKLRDIVRIITPPKKLQKTEFGKIGMYPIIDQSQNEIAGWTNESTAIINMTKPVVIFGDHTCSIKYAVHPFVQGADGIKILETNNLVQPRFLFYWLKTFPIQSDGYKRHFSKLIESVIPLPPLDEQERIVVELDGYQKVIEGARQVAASWKPNIDVDSEWEKVKLGEVATLMTGGTPLTSKKEYYGGNIKWLVSGDINKGEIFDCAGRITEIAVKESNARLLPVDSVLIALNGQGKTRGTVAILRTEAACNQSLVSINPDRNKLIPEFLLYVLKGKYQEIRNINGDNERGGLNMPIIRSIQIPLPPLETQKQIVEKIEVERVLVESNRKLAKIFEKKIQLKLAEIWGEIEVANERI